MITAIVTSDNHLGAYYARMRPDLLERRRRRLQLGFERAVDCAISRGVGLFLQAGDLFDRPDPRNADRRFVAEQLRRLRDAGIPVFAIAGNHDSPRSYGYDGGVTPHEELQALGGIHLFRGSDLLQTEALSIGGHRVCVSGMSSDFNRPPDCCPLDGSTSPPAPLPRGEGSQGDIHIVLLHYGVEGWAQPFAAEPCLARRNLDALGADAVCVGHLHTRAEARMPGGGLLLNPGATEHIHFGEEALEAGCWLLRLEPGRAYAEYLPFVPQPMRTLTVTLDEATEDPTAFVRECMSGVCAADQLLRVRLTGRLRRNALQDLDIAALQAEGAAHNFYCQVETDALTAFDPGADIFVEIGFSFDVREELRTTAEAMAKAHADDAVTAEVYRLAGQELTAACDRIAGGNR